MGATAAAAAATNVTVTTTATTTTTSASQDLAQQVSIIAYCYVLPAICVLGILGNITNLVTLLSRRLRAVSYMYLRALAVADLMCMLFVLVFVLFEILGRQGVQLQASAAHAFYQTHFMLTLINWALGTGVLVVVALSLERYISIVFPMHFRTWNSPQRARIAIGIAYVVPAVLYIPYGIGRYTTTERLAPDNRTIHYLAVDSELSKRLGWQFYKWTREALLRFGPIVFLCVLNAQIVLAFRKRQKMFSRLTRRKEHGQNARDDTLVYMLLGTVAMFFVCNIPAAINLILIDERLKRRPDYQVFRALANLLEIMNHASQFYVFCACSQDYRATFLQKFPCLHATYAQRSRLRSFVRRTPTVNNGRERHDLAIGSHIIEDGQDGGGLLGDGLLRPATHSSIVAPGSRRLASSPSSSGGTSSSTGGGPPGLLHTATVLVSGATTTTTAPSSSGIISVAATAANNHLHLHNCLQPPNASSVVVSSTTSSAIAQLSHPSPPPPPQSTPLSFAAGGLRTTAKLASAESEDDDEDEDDDDDDEEEADEDDSSEEERIAAVGRARRRLLPPESAGSLSSSSASANTSAATGLVAKVRYSQTATFL